ncbi:uncharacterized protein LOC123293996 [Chrysoperla carnea]|uniref:uncharacterized protein LOC123293996 n=1 Tax=Chrysoperla carnea TaxID=189513 RepID=UPI001D06868B|nr:uncharacterized protein LOC123293996 [Chrysoperla carnea]
MSGESGSESSGDEFEGKGFTPINKYTIILLDSTTYMKEDLKQCLTDLHTIYAALQTSAHIRHFSTGVITIGCKFLENESENTVLVQPKTFDITRLESVVRNFNPDKCVNKILPLKDGIEMATDLIMTTCRAKPKDIKDIVLITNNPAPELDDPDDATSAARTLSMNKIDFTIFPSRFFSSSKFYSSFCKQLPDDSYTLLQIESTFLETLCHLLEPHVKLQSTKFYINEHHCFEMKALKIFQTKYRSLSKVVDRGDGKIQRARWTQGVDQSGFTTTKLLKLDDDNNAVGTMAHDEGSVLVPKTEFNKMCKIGLNEQEAVFTKEELAKIEQKCGEPKPRALYLMYLGNIVDTHIPSDDVRSRLLLPGKADTDKTMFYSFWLYCIENDKAIYCNYLTKIRPYLVLKPILFKDQPMFLQYCVGYVNNYRCTKIPNNNNTDKGFLDLRDSKVLFEEALLNAKRTKTEFEFDNDGLSMEEHHVDKRIGDLVQQFESNL